MKSDNTRQLATVIDYGGNEGVVESRNLAVDDTDLTLPSKFSFGVGFGKKKLVGWCRSDVARK